MSHRSALSSPFESETTSEPIIDIGMEALAALSGHRNIATMQRYIEFSDHALRAAMELV
jgi:hypothetical protein